jgi:hypothetical protein
MAVHKLLLSTLLFTAASLSMAEDNSAPTQVYFGDTHLHTSYSFDAFLNNNHSADPDTAYRWAKGQPVIHPYNRARVQIQTPLDFLVVSDHAEMLGVMKAVRNDSALFADLGIWASLKRWYAMYLMTPLIRIPEWSFLGDFCRFPLKGRAMVIRLLTPVTILAMWLFLVIPLQ